MATSVNTPDKVTYFAETDYRSKRIKFGIRDEDRERHMYIIGKTGMGKSTLLENLAIQDIQNGEGLCFIDPHGGTAETLLSYIPEHRVKDVIYFAPFDQEHPVALNVMEDIGRDKRPLVASGLIGAFKKVWVDAWSARMEYILSNALLALLEYPGATLLGVNRIFADKNYRSLIVNNVTDPSVKAFWVDEYAKYSDKFATEATAAIQNKVGQFAANPLIRNMVGQSKSTFDIRKVMDERKILIVNLSKGRMGEGNANLVGSMLITKIYLAAMSRADVGPEVVKGLPPFYLYVDEFQSFANESFADILSEARKYKLSLTIAHQYIEQMSDEVRAAVFGNVGSMIAFRVGAYDAEVLEKEYAPAFTAEDMVNLGARQIYLKLMINGVGSSPFSATTLNRPAFPPRMYTNEVIAMSRAQFGRPRAEVEDEIRKWHEPISEPPRDPNAPEIPETRKYAPGMRPFRPAPAGASAAYTGPVRSALPERVTERHYPLHEIPAPMLQPQGSTHLEIPAATLRAPIAPEPVDKPRASSTGNAQLREHHPAEQPLQPIEEKSFRPRESVQLPSTRTQGEPQLKSSGQVHQPFREEFVKIHSDRLDRGERPAGGRERNTDLDRDRGQAQAGMHAPRHAGQTGELGRSVQGLPSSSVPVSRPAPLSSLKSQQKRDKGPSTENLSSLKMLIDAAFANGKDGEQKKENTITADTAPIASSPAPLPPPARAGLTSDLSAPHGGAQTGKQAQIFPQQHSEKQAPPPSLLNDEPSLPNLKEVPEDVLRGVLAE